MTQQEKDTIREALRYMQRSIPAKKRLRRV